MHDATLLLIDVQTGLDDPRLGQRNNLQAESNMARLLLAWRGLGLPVVHVRHASTEPGSPLRPELPGHAIKAEVAPLPAEPLFTKSVNSAFVGTGLEDHLRAAGATSLVVVGLTTEHCVSTSVRMAANLGFDVTLVADACAAFARRAADGTGYDADTVHAVNVASLDGEFCTVRDTQAVLAALPALA